MAEAPFVTAHSESTTLGVRQAKRPRAQVFSEDPILLPEIVDQIVLVTVHPASEREDEELQRRRHSLRLLGRLDQHRPSLGRFFAPYAMHRTVRVWRQAPAMRASRQWAPVFLRTAGGTGVRGDAEQSPSIEDSSRRPRARSQRPRCSTGGSGTTCGTKDTRPSRATQLVRPPSVSPSVGLRMRSIVPSARAALGVLGHARSDARTLNSFGNLAMPLFSFFHLSALLQ